MPPPFIEKGLRSGQAFVEDFISCTQPTAPTKPALPLVWLSDLKMFLDDHDYVMTLMDKNLGAAVVQQDWLEAGAVKLLSDIHNYRKVIEVRVDLQTDCMRKAINKLTTDTVHDWNMFESDPQLAKFLQSKISESKMTLPEFPEFYVIPKIHKTPTGYRLIVPCHSLMQEPASKVVSKMLKPLYANYPTVIHGTKDLVRKLSTLELSRHRKVFIVTGDIVAYYPNIPLDKVAPIILKMFMDYATQKSTCSLCVYKFP